jgi:hypothetical protein
MSSKLPPGIHSVFKERVVLSVRAPEGNSERAGLMRKLVEEMAERKATGHLNDWIVEALLERMVSQAANAKHGMTSACSGAACQPGEGRAVEQSQPVERVLPPAHAAEHGDGVDTLVAATATTPKAMPSGLKGVM